MAKKSSRTSPILITIFLTQFIFSVIITIVNIIYFTYSNKLLAKPRLPIPKKISFGFSNLEIATKEILNSFKSSYKNLKIEKIKNLEVKPEQNKFLSILISDFLHTIFIDLFQSSISRLSKNFLEERHDRIQINKSKLKALNENWKESYFFVKLILDFYNVSSFKLDQELKVSKKEYEKFIEGINKKSEEENLDRLKELYKKVNELNCKITFGSEITFYNSEKEGIKLFTTQTKTDADGRPIETNKHDVNGTEELSKYLLDNYRGSVLYSSGNRDFKIEEDLKAIVFENKDIYFYLQKYLKEFRERDHFVIENFEKFRIIEFYNGGEKYISCKGSYFRVYLDGKLFKLEKVGMEKFSGKEMDVSNWIYSLN